MLQRGDTVTIYFDPITRENAEGEALLIKQYREDHGDGLSLWVVRFWDDDLSGEVIRTVYYKEEA
jgi:hypothetical protein